METWENRGKQKETGKYGKTYIKPGGYMGKHRNTGETRGKQ